MSESEYVLSIYSIPCLPIHISPPRYHILSKHVFASFPRSMLDSFLHVPSKPHPSIHPSILSSFRPQNTKIHNATLHNPCMQVRCSSVKRKTRRRIISRAARHSFFGFGFLFLMPIYEHERRLVPRHVHPVV